MTNLFGEYECKLDDKGRLKLPSALLNQLDENQSREFVANRGYEPCLYLFPKDIWNIKFQKIQGLSDFNADVRNFRRVFLRGATLFTPDKADRILLPKPLLEWASIDKTLIISALGDMLEIWNVEAYYKTINVTPEQLQAMANRIDQLKTKGSDE